MSIDFGRKTLYDLILPGTHGKSEHLLTFTLHMYKNLSLTSFNIHIIAVIHTADTGSYVIDFGQSCCKGLTPRGAYRLLTSLPLRLLLRRPLINYSRTQHLTIYEQLQAGSRFQDFRVSKLSSRSDTRFWLIHGQVASIPLEVALEDMNRYHDECTMKTPIVTVIRRLPWKKFTKDDDKDLADFLKSRLRHGIFEGSAGLLRSLPYVELPENVVAGVPGISGEGLADSSWGSDIWIDTYDTELKVAGNTRQAADAKERVERDNLFVLAWTITPHVSHILKSVFTFSRAKIPTLEKQAQNMNEYVVRAV